MPVSETSSFALFEDWINLRSEGRLRHRVLRAGHEGPLLLFVHAASLCAGVWAPVQRRLRSHRGIAWDQRGHGDSDAPDEGAAYSWSRFGEDFVSLVEAVTEQEGRAPDACITHSFAGDCALVGLAERPVPAGRMILLDPVLADAEGATVGAARLAKGTRRLGEKEAEGFASPDEVEAGLEKVLRAQLARERLDPEARASFAKYGSAPDAAGRWRLKCRRESEAFVYENRVALADHLAERNVDADVRLVFSEKRRAKPEDQETAFARDWGEATRVIERCTVGEVMRLDNVGHFLVLEAPDLVAETIELLLSS